MKAIIFAGGAGTRLWPLSRKKSPKQFEQIIDNRSTLQLAFERLAPKFKPEDIYISTNETYIPLVKKQLPKIPVENILGEPEKKDVGPAVALATAKLFKKNPDEPIIILWSDHLVKKGDKFLKVISAAEKMIKQNGNKIIFIGQKPRFASQNLGWIKFGEKMTEVDRFGLHKFLGFRYRPDHSTAETYMKEKKYCWNLGYFVTTPKFLHEQFKRFTPKIYNLVEKILKTSNKKYYLEMPSISFDNAVLEQLDSNMAYVITEDIGWTDIGAWEALKEALELRKESNVTLGKVILEESRDNLVYNYEDSKTIVGLDLEDFVVVNTKDILLVTKKTSVSKIKKFVGKLEESENHGLL